MRFQLKKDSFSNERCAPGRCGGFTLIELLVVIAIITLLMAIMLPALSRARTMSVRLMCKNNLKQIAFACQMYTDDNEGKFYQNVNAQLSDEFTKAKVFKCPADDGSLIFPFYEMVGTSYQTNKLLIGQDETASLGDAGLTSAINARLRGVKLSSVAGPAKLVLVGDYTWASQWIPGDLWGVPWHRQHCHFNVAFLDGHVAFLRIRKGLFVTPEYNILPFKDLYSLAMEVQEEEPCEFCE